MIILPWPDKALSPNARVHWTKKAKAAKAMRKIAGWETKISKQKIDWDGEIHLHAVFYPPDARHRDEDNLIASAKSLYDGIADGLGVNDKRFRLHSIIAAPVKGGKITVEIKQQQ